ncbi:MAG: hypothetical protein LBN74_01010 [Prevotella sp.]|jgi:hypothetical protein|nr:hypothetical protein [Prevotella sp.]
MNKQLTLNEEIAPFFNTDDRQIWNLILENKIDELLTALPAEQDSLTNRVLAELFTEGKSDTLYTYDFVTVKESNSILFRNLIRLIFALDINGNHEAVKEAVIAKLFDSVPDMVEKLQSDAHGYPVRRVSELVVTEAASVRMSLNTLAYYFREKEDVDDLHFAIVMRTKLTLSIMSNYKNVVGRDMIEAAKIKEQIGENEAALVFYNAAVENLKNELHWFVESPEMGPSEDDTIMLKSLKEAYLSIDRLNNTSEFTDVSSLIDEILSREYIEYDFEEEDDEDDE